jgi:3-carboxy-cis,cis-muconate cycloisomerase
MPHKRNPVSSAVALAASVRAPGLVASMLAAMPQEHERGLGGWQAEWALLPELVRVAGGAARAMAEALEGLVVDRDRMATNLRITGGLTQAEAVVAALAPHVGRADAHARVEAACAVAVRERRPLHVVLEADAVVTGALGKGAVPALLAPDRYLGQAEAMVDRVLIAWRAGATADA